MRARYVVLVLLVALYWSATPASAVVFTNIRIGDTDGFGFSPTTGLKAASGADADTNGNGLLEQTEFLPSLNLNASVATGSGDDFDNRSAGAEVGGTLITGGLLGFTDTGTFGSQWTDISLSTSFPGPNFPDAGGTGTPNEPLFGFRFDVTKGDIVFGSTLFFNLIFGDYDVFPADVELTTNDGSGGPNGMQIIPLTLQQSIGPGQDGLIQAATLSLPFTDVFSDGGTVWNGFLDVKFRSPNEPYTAFDFAELSLEQIPFEPIPEPSSLLVWSLLAMVGLAAAWRRRKAA